MILLLNSVLFIYLVSLRIFLSFCPMFYLQIFKQRENGKNGSYICSITCLLPIHSELSFRWLEHSFLKYFSLPLWSIQPSLYLQGIFLKIYFIDKLRSQSEPKGTSLWLQREDPSAQTQSSLLGLSFRPTVFGTLPVTVFNTKVALSSPHSILFKSGPWHWQPPLTHPDTSFQVK